MHRQRLNIEDLIDLIDRCSVREAGEALHMLVENYVVCAKTGVSPLRCWCLFHRKVPVSVDDDELH